MSNKIGILIIHGIGEQNADFANSFIANIKNHLPEKTKSFVDFEPVFWASITEEKENILQEKNKPFNLSWNFLRNFLIHYAGDALAYQRFCTRPGLYRKINKKIFEGIKNLESRNGECPLMIISHSLGTVIAQNYIWDRQNSKNKSFEKTKVQKMETLCSIVTSGSPIPLFLLGVDVIKPLEFPGKSTGIAINKEELNWLNFYDKDDIISFPLAPHVEDCSVIDIPVNVGNWLTSWNPLSHREYWKNEKVLDDISKTIKNLVFSLINKKVLDK